ncbi:MAG: DUF4340 domain-containing protein [Planctomycetota bacterium]|jgi:hypothetical protein
MSPVIKTVTYAAAAIGLAFLAMISSPGGKDVELFNDEGELFFEDFVDPLAATDLEVWEFISDTAEASAFNVKSDKGYWTIPSHSNYPADAKDRMAEAAVLLIDLRKASVRSDLVVDHAKFGVVDPTEQDLDLEGRGKRITFRDRNGSVLGDLIVGNEVENRPGQFYVRLPGKKRTYTAERDFDLSTKFEDWIERDLLKVSAADLNQLTFDNYSVDETRNTLVKGDIIELEKPETDWVVKGLAEDEETQKDVITEAQSTLTGLKIVGVRPKPEGLTAALEQAQGITREILASQLARKGFFFSGGKLYSNEGDLILKTSKGVVYTLKFGEVIYGTGDAITAGGGDETAGTQEASAGEDAANGSHRYLMVTASFDASLLEAPEGTPVPQSHLDKLKTARNEMDKVIAAIDAYAQNKGEHPPALSDLVTGEQKFIGGLPKDPWEKDFVYEKTEDGFVLICVGEDGAVGGEGVNADLRSDAFNMIDDEQAIVDRHQTHANKVTESEEEVQKLNERFGPWYYVIDAEAFNKLHLSREQLVKKKEVEEKPEAGKDGGPGEGK